MTIFRLLLLLVFIAVIEPAFAQINNSSTPLTAVDFKQRIDTALNKNILDVRTPEEFATGYITGAKNIDFYDKNFASKTTVLDKNTPVYVYCKGGLRSAGAVAKLQELGFTQVYDLKGGIMAWTNQELPLAAAKPEMDTYTIEQFDSLLQNNPKVLIDFYAEWCLPCKKMEPGLHKLQQAYQGKVMVIRINVDEARALTKKLKIEELPVLATYHNGKEIKRVSGYQTDVDMKKLIREL